MTKRFERSRTVSQTHSERRLEMQSITLRSRAFVVTAVVVATAIVAAVFPLLAFAGLLPGVPAAAQILVVMALAGLPVAGVYLFPATLTADIIDYDSLRTGFRREATYYQLHSFVEQIATSLAPAFLAGLLLLGDTAANPLGIRLVGPAAGLLVLVGYLAFRHYDLPDEVLAVPRPPRPHEVAAGEPGNRSSPS
jgi:Na+/melibiose symporter-like transporter